MQSDSFHLFHVLILSLLVYVNYSLFFTDCAIRFFPFVFVILVSVNKLFVCLFLYHFAICFLLVKLLLVSPFLWDCDLNGFLVSYVNTECNFLWQDTHHSPTFILFLGLGKCLRVSPSLKSLNINTNKVDFSYQLTFYDLWKALILQSFLWVQKLRVDLILVSSDNLFCEISRGALIMGKGLR